MIFAFALYQLTFCFTQILPREITATFDGSINPEKRVFYPNETITLKQTKFTNFNVENNGGAIYIYCSYSNKVVTGANCSVEDCEFISCSASEGGAIYVFFTNGYSFMFSISGTTIKDCHATDGGAIFLHNSQDNIHTFIVTKCQFESNIATNGGAIYGEIRDKFTIQGCQFINNEANTLGSSMFLKLGASGTKKNGEQDNFIIADCSFAFTPKETNKVNVYIQSINSVNNVELGGCTFSATNPIDQYYHLEVTEVSDSKKFESFNFTKCNCFMQDIKTFSVPDTFNPVSNVSFGCESIDKCTPTETENPNPKPTDEPLPPPGEYQSHDRIDGLTKNLNLVRNTFTDFKDASKGGAIYINADKNNNYNCSLTDCKFTSCGAEIGGAIYTKFSGAVSLELLLTSCVFQGCEAIANGGALYLYNTQYDRHIFTISQCTFTSNKAANGGAIYGEQVRNKLTIEGCTFQNNEAVNGSSLWLSLGISNPAKTDKNYVYDIIDNVFTYAPSQERQTNVYIQNINITNGNDPTRDLNIGGCTFSISNQYSPFKHLEINSIGSGFSNINFNKCNCVQQDKSTFSVPEDSLKNINFECTSIGSCKPTPIRPEIPADTENYETKTDRYNQTGEKIQLSGVEFYKIHNLEGKGGAIYMDTVRNDCILDNCKFTLCEAQHGAAIYIQYAQKDVNYTAKITNTIFTNCISERDGGAIYIIITQPVNHSFTLEGCTFESNSAGQEGGAIYATVRDRFTVKNCKFTGNKATNQGSSIYMTPGYAGSEKNDKFIIEDSEFIFTPTKEGSSNIYIKTPPISEGKNYKNANIYISGCSFSIASETSVKSFKHLEVLELIEFESFHFDKCNCVQQGSETISLPDSAYPINNFNFNCQSIDNCNPETPITLPPPEKPDDDGFTSHDRINDEGQTINLEKAKFANINSKNLNGGAILVDSNRVSCNLTNCKFTSCNAKNGGAIYLTYSGSSKFACTITSTEFTSCSADENGGALYLKITQTGRHSITLTNCKFIGNKASQNGGAIYAQARDNFKVDSCIFEDNNATLGSSIWSEIGYGQITTNKTNNVIIISSSFAFTPFENAANVYIKSYKLLASDKDGKNIPNANLHLSLCRFLTTNANTNNYKHLIVDDSEAKFESINFDHCNCIRNKENENTISLPEGYKALNFAFDCQLMDTCKADPEGFKLHDRIVAKEPVELNDYKFVNVGDQGEDGGSIYAKKFNCTINHCKFEMGKSRNGGAVYLACTGSNETYICTITNSQFIDCEAVTNGGALYLYITQSNLHSITVTDCKFVSNTAGKNGGAIYAETRDSFTLNNCEFIENVCGKNGSSLWCKLGWDDRYNLNVVTIQNNKFTFTPVDKNSINVFISSKTLNSDVTPNANLVLGGCTFSATKDISAKYLHLKIYQFKSQFESINFSSCNCIQQKNTTVYLPSQYNAENYFTFNCNDIGSCTAKPAPVTPLPTPDTDGYIPSPDRINRLEFDQKIILIKVKFTKFVLSNPKYYGGAIYASKVPCSLTECKIDSCQSTRGGGIYVYYTGDLGNYSCSIIDTLFINCNATDGGAVYASITQPERHYITIEGCTFNENKASGNGGAIYSTIRDGFSVQHCTFNNNQAESQGSSIWCRIGQDQGKKVSDLNNRVIFYGNTITFTPSESNKINVYIESNQLNENTEPNANLFFGRNTLAAETSNVQDYKLLQIKENGKFQSLVFTECNCIKGSESTVDISVNPTPSTSNLLFYNCQNIDQCPSGQQPPSSGNCEKNRKESFGEEVSYENKCFENLAAPVSREGGAIRVVNAKVEIEDCKFTSCTSNENGGAIYVLFSGENCELEIEDCSFVSCVSGGNGGAIYFVNRNPNCKSSFENIRFENNTALLSAGAFYYSPCANSQVKGCFFLNNNCTTNKAKGLSLYAFIENNYKNTLSSKGKKEIKEDEAVVKPVIIESNRFRSEPVGDSSQLYINLKKTGQLHFNTNSFSFNNANEIPNYSRYVYLNKDESAVFEVNDKICVDNAESLLYGIDPSLVETNCHKADAINDATEGEPNKKGNKTGMIVGIVVAVVVVIAVVVVVVVIVLKKKSNNNRYVSDLNEDEIADNATDANTEGNL